MRSVVWSDRARRDFRTQIEFIARRDASAARLVADRIEAAIGQLARMPIGRPGRVFGTYEKSVSRTSHIIAYELNGKSRLTILRIIHMARDWPPGTWPD